MYDIIIVGGGIAGSFVASLLDAGLNVLLIEKNKKTIPKDSGIVSNRFCSIFPDKTLIKAEITDIELISPTGKTFTLHNDQPYASILHRERFGEFLQKRAQTRATIRFEFVQDIRYHKTHVEVMTNKETYECSLLIGCDGANSFVRKHARIAPPRISTGVMVKTKKYMPGPIRVYFNKNFSQDFFSWVIPPNSEYGLMTALQPAHHLQMFKREFHLPDGQLFAYPIPTGFTRSYAHRTLLIGDSCGQSKPLTGGGIMFSLAGAQCAANTINDMYRQHTFDRMRLDTYEQQWKKQLAWEIRKQLLVRKAYKNLTNHDIDTLFAAFGPSLASLRHFDYDHFSKQWKNLPKQQLLMFGLTHLHTLL